MAGSHVVTVSVIEAAGWEVVGALHWSRVVERVRWDFSLEIRGSSRWRVWTLEAREKGNNWLFFDAEYRPDRQETPEQSYEFPQGLIWAELQISLMTPILEAVARQQHGETARVERDY